MILNYNSVNESQSTNLSMEAWLAKLQEGKKSLQQLQTEMLESTTENIDKFKEKTAAKAKENAKEKAKESEGDTLYISDSEYIYAKEDIDVPSEVTKEDLKSPIDLKL